MHVLRYYIFDVILGVVYFLWFFLSMNFMYTYVIYIYKFVHLKMLYMDVCLKSDSCTWGMFFHKVCTPRINNQPHEEVHYEELHQ